MADPDDDGPKYQQNWQRCWVILSEHMLNHVKMRFGI